jgi:hypothetical protein
MVARMMRLLAIGLSLSVFLLGACGDDDDDAPAGGDADVPGADAGPTPDGSNGGQPDAAPPDDDEMAKACAPVITYENTSTSGDGDLFDDHVADKQAYFAARSLEVCKQLYKTAAEVPPRPTLKFVVEDEDGVAYTLCSDTSCGEMHLNAGYLRDYKNGGGNLGKEIDGVIVHELAHVYQHMWGGPPGWVIEGEADFVRYRAGYIPESNRHKGGNYDDAYQTTAFFFDYVDHQVDDFEWNLNQAKSPEKHESWSDGIWQELTGKGVQQLWDEYQATL